MISYLIKITRIYLIVVALVLYVTLQKTKEIGTRKVFGATRYE